jgi:hypothetical protein
MGHTAIAEEISRFRMYQDPTPDKSSKTAKPAQSSFFFNGQHLPDQLMGWEWILCYDTC